MVNYPAGSRTRYSGYGWKLCPYSTAYEESYYDNGIQGPSNHPDLFNNPSWGALNTTDHTTTSGTMQYCYSGCAGWICRDPACYYYTAEVPGVWYFES